MRHTLAVWVPVLCLLLGYTSLGSSSPQSARFNPKSQAKRLVNKFPFIYDEDNSDHGATNERFIRNIHVTSNLEQEERENCSDIHNPPPKYNGSMCELIREECDDKYELFNYLDFVLCGLGESLQPLGFIILGLWLIYLLSLLSTTVDKFFVPVLQMIADKLHLPPSIAGMTLLALGNGAPDIFVAFSAFTKDDDLTLVLGALMGAGLFITTVVLGLVLMVSKSRNYNIDRIDFMRDIIAFMVVLVVIVGVSIDGKVYLVEVSLFPLTYIGYVVAVLGITIFRKWYRNKKHKANAPPEKVAFNKQQSQIVIKEPEQHPGEDGPVTREEIEKTIEKSTNIDESKKQEEKNEKSADTSDIDTRIKVENYKQRVVLPGLTWPQGWFKRVHFIIEWPFTLLRWLTIPPCCHDGNWTIFHYCFAVFSPIPMSILFMIVASEHWSVFEMTVGESSFPVPVLVVICVAPLCVPLMFLLKPRKPPNKVMQVIFMIAAFVTSICWLYLIADEVVSVLQAIGLLASISTAILGLTVLAIGNSVADLVADTVVSINGKPEMALASCFGAPLITYVMGLSFAFLAKMISEDGQVYEFDIFSEEFVHVKMAWIFLGFVLLGSAVVFPLFKFSPPREYGVILMYVYCVFMIFSVLIEVDVMKVFV